MCQLISYVINLFYLEFSNKNKKCFQQQKKKKNLLYEYQYFYMSIRIWDIIITKKLALLYTKNNKWIKFHFGF